MKATRCTNVRQDRMIVRQAQTTARVTLSTIRCTTASSIPHVVPSTISRRLAEARLHSQRPLRHAFGLTILAESSGGSQPIIMVVIGLSLIIFNDESRFTFKADDHLFHV
ncbi:hypothetical protein TNCV_2155891 [Trichonephila clavipes]|nr:hypothetical protein TNCV_2155891 [Trichonephila clavipes]